MPAALRPIVAAFPERRRAERSRRRRAAGARRARAASAGSGTAFGSRILHPATDFAARGNDSSCVLKVEAGASSLLVTGDIERRGESALLDAAASPPTSSSCRITAARRRPRRRSSRPSARRHAIVSAGSCEPLGIPAARGSRALAAERGGRVVTGDSGAVSVELGARAASPSRRNVIGRHRYWHAPRFSW